MKSKIFKAMAMAFAFALVACDGDLMDSLSSKKKPTDQIMPIRVEIERIQALILQAMGGIDNGDTDFDMDGGRRAVKNIESAVREFASCAVSSVVEETNESILFEIDFGDGCQTEDGLIVSGKLIMKITFSEDGKFTFETELINYKVEFESSDDEFYSKPVTINGKSSGTDSGFEGTSVHRSTQKFRFIYEDGSFMEYSSVQQIENDDQGFRVRELTLKGSRSNGDKFETKVIKPLVTRFSCGDDIYTHVEGVEVWTYNGQSVEVDYGNGTCDNEFTTR